jgi:hypothetical protein
VNIFVNLKSIGKRKKRLERVPYTLPDGIETLRGLIEAVARGETESYNTRGADNMLVDFLTERQIDDKASVGKVDFGRLHSENRADPEEAVSVAVQGFEDGLFRVLIGDAEAADLDALLEIREGDTLTFIRLTFLAGRLW